jgi:hypothetical protein
MWCDNSTDNSTNPALKCFINLEGLNCRDLLEGMVHEFMSWLAD